MKTGGILIPMYKCIVQKNSIYKKYMICKFNWTMLEKGEICLAAILHNAIDFPGVKKE